MNILKVDRLLQPFVPIKQWLGNGNRIFCAYEIFTAGFPGEVPILEVRGLLMDQFGCSILSITKFTISEHRSIDEGNGILWLARNV
jgi:hypothetical protein